VGLERLAPEPGGEPTPTPTPTPTQAWGGSAERFEDQERPRVSKRDRRAAEVAARIAEDPTGYARQVCLDLLQARPRTRQELTRALAKKGVPEDAAVTVLERFTDVGLIDDALFASLWVTSRHRGKGLAGRALSQELRRKGVDDELVREAVGELEPEQEEQTARDLVRRKLPATRGLAADARVRRLAGMLARKGYAGGLAFRVVKEELEAEGAELPDLDTDGLSHLG